MPAKKTKTLKDVYGKTWGAGGKSPAESMKPKKTNRSMNALDKAISEGKPLPSKNKKYPGDTDVGMKGFKKKPIIKVKSK